MSSYSCMLDGPFAHHLVCKQDDIYGEDIYGGVSEPTKADASAHTNSATLVQAHQVPSFESVI